MTKHKHEKKHPQTFIPEISPVRAPTWAHAHRDWRFLAVVFLMMVALVTYVMTGNLAWRPDGHELPLLDSGGK